MRLAVAVTGFLALLLAAPAPVLARDRGQSRDGHPAPDGNRGGSGRGMSAGQAADAARRQTGGRVLSVEGGRNGYRVKVLTPTGEVRYVVVPAGR